MTSRGDLFTAAVVVLLTFFGGGFQSSDISATSAVWLPVMENAESVGRTDGEHPERSSRLVPSPTRAPNCRTRARTHNG